jgi:hypothetical protein
LKAEINWPREFYVSPQAKDFVEKLLKVEPSERLGAGKPGSDNDYSKLISHVYFSSIGNVVKMKVPLELPKSIIIESQLDFQTGHLSNENTNPANIIVREGILKKRNEWYMKQPRRFVL